MESLFHQIAKELNIGTQQVSATVALLDDGSTVPFIARYRKEATDSLDDTQLRKLEERLHYLRELEDRRTTIINSIKDQDKLTPALEKSILNAETKTALEDLYLPYKPKRKTKGQIAIKAGLEPLADTLLNDRSLNPETEAEKYLNQEHNISDVKVALEGAKYILMERFVESAELLGKVRRFLWDNSYLSSRLVTDKKMDKKKEAQKFSDYFSYNELLKRVPSHRALAVLRGRKEGFLTLSLSLPGIEVTDTHPCQSMVADHWNIHNEGQPADLWLSEVVRWTWRIKLLPQMETDLIGDVRQSAEDEAIRVFAENLKDLLLASPAGPRVTMGLDPGLRTGVKVAIVDATGKLTDHTTIYPHAPQNRTTEAQGLLVKLILKHQVELVAIGNGTASRETDRLMSDLMKQLPKLSLKKIMVSESGASVYSASELASKEFPDLDVVFRGAVSIARRLQDPLAELVKIEPKSIGVGQYQHDVSQSHLARTLEATVEDCVNAVGVDINMASTALLRRVAGLNTTIAENIVKWRDTNGVFINRSQLLNVERMGNKSFEQSAGFLKIMNGENALDSSAVHPEAYTVVEKIAEKKQCKVEELIGDTTFLANVKAADFTNDAFGLPTVIDIISELKKPGRDPRPEFKTANFREGVEAISDLKPDMVLEGVISNVTNFGAFVDVGVHQDGLVHISSLCNHFVKDPRKVVKAGDVVKVKVLEVDADRRRISLSMRLDEAAFKDKSAPASKKAASKKPTNRKQAKNVRHKKSQESKKPEKVGTFADLFANAKQLRK